MKLDRASLKQLVALVYGTKLGKKVWLPGKDVDKSIGDGWSELSCEAVSGRSR